ncbi:ATP-binding protein, partial [Nonomuraea sp. NPDC050556]|uniref:ATP-binding protein n=1 Tax=Nonomuraea sp. NPDC050556 TaxID=3364369 RepID=UPI0037BD6CB1
ASAHVASAHVASAHVASAHVASAHVASAHVASAHVASGRVAEAVAAVLGLRDDLDGPGPQPSGNSRTSGTSRVSADGQASGGLREAADAQALAGRVAGALRGRGALLVLDNCEHVIDEAADFVGMLLAAAPDARVLATSREPLRLTGEHLWLVPPLTLPSEPPERDGFHQAATTNPRAAGDATPSGPDGARPTSSAVELFVTRVHASAPGIALDDEAVAVICRRLDGIPLALELAATRVRALGVREVAARLDDRFRMLGAGARDAPARQRTLWSVIDWSWELLDEEERLVLRRLAVHADGCTLEAASAVSGFDAAAPLAQLVDRSLVTVVHNADAPRYRLLESVAAYCMEHVTTDDRLRERHRAYYVDLAERAERELRGPDQRRWLARLDAESPNLRLALDGAPADLALRLVAALSWYWFLRGRLSEARRSLAIALNTPHEGQTTTRGSGSDDQPTHTAAAARPAGTTTRGEPTGTHEEAAKGNAQRETATAPGDQPHHEATTHEGALAPDEVAVPDGVARHRRAATSEEGATREGAASLSERPTADEEQAAGDAVGARHDAADAVGAGHEVGEAVSLAGGTGGAGLRVGVLGWLAGIRGALGEVVDEAVGDPRGEWFLAHVRWAYGDFAVHEERVDAVIQSSDDPWTIAAALSTRARLVMARGDLAAARRDAERALGMFREMSDAWGQVEAAEGLSALAEITGDYERAESLRTDALRLAEELGLWTKVSFTLANLGRVAMLRGDYPRAEELHHRAAKLAAEQSYRSGQEFAEVGLGLLARRQGRLDEAEHRLRAWLGWLGEVKGAAGTAFILAELGFVAEQRGDAEAALALQLEGHAQAEATGSPRAIALALEGLAGAYSLAAHHLATTTNPVHPRITSPHGQEASEAAEHPQEVTAPQAEASHLESSEALGAVDGAQGVAGPGEKAAHEHQAPRRKGRETVDAPQRKGRQAGDAPQREGYQTVDAPPREGRPSVAALRGKAVELLEQATHLRTSVGTPLAYGERGDVARILARLETIRDV